MDTLYSISKDIQELEFILDNIDDLEWAHGADQEALHDALKRLKLSKNEKVEQLLKLYHIFEARFDEAEREIKRLKAISEKRWSKMESIKNYLSKFCEGEKYSFSCGDIGWRTSKSVEPLPSPDGVPPEIPNEFKRVKIEESLDKVGIRKAMEAGAFFEGWALVEKKNIQLK